MAAKNTIFSSKTIFNCRGQLLDLSAPAIMAIINVTPDSFYDGGRWRNEKEMLIHAELMLRQGARILDVGGMSSRPGAAIISEAEESERVIPAIKSLSSNFPDAVIAVDTWRSNVLLQAVEAGASMANDISGGTMDGNYWKVVAQQKLPYVLMHMNGRPDTMQDNPTYDDVVSEVFEWFRTKIIALNEAGIYDIIPDPGFGFGKTITHNFQLLKQLPLFRIFGLPILAGVSRKSMVCKVLQLRPGEALNGTTALNAIALLHGASILRVHDVKEAKETIQLIQELNAAPD